MKKIFALAAILLSLAATPATAHELNVVASFSVLGDIVARVGGDKISLTVLVGPDGDAHTFEPSPKDAKALAHADLVVVNGLHFETWMDKLVAASGYKGPIAVASKGIVPREMVEDGHTIPDPHAWQDLANGAIYVHNVAAMLKAASPENAATFEANAATLSKEIADLDRWTHDEISSVPQQKRMVITTHDAFGYFGAAYGVTFRAPEGLSTEAEPSAGALAGLIDQIKREKIKALFIENMTDPRLIQMIARETGAVMGGELYSDALSKPGGPAPTYPAMFRNNVPKLVSAMMKN
ncbi:metal ABC transporter substrate-binding protein [Parvibaculum sedimenti]|uniref:Metal ABC transporter substrate-binding protein n=1 Tax=Parvibaculum sedimenti TaxID=2608632 RepID=A0A6N6VJM6_9HYPH|nr:metal ABC transporter substrate-binding protein [Parvibaculum sedimenti]KAB7739481.1 metal ABC transporter substrate-binding protein [Parvibaculum sedimenti]